MDNEIRIKIIERFDSYFAGINNKGAFLLAFNTFLLGAFIVSYKDLVEQIDCSILWIFNLLIGLISLTSIVCRVWTIIEIMPYLKSTKIKNEKSNLFFNDIATEDKNSFFERINNTDEKKQIVDLNNQIHELSKGLRNKHILIKTALIFNLIGILFLLSIIYLILA